MFLKKHKKRRKDETGSRNVRGWRGKKNGEFDSHHTITLTQRSHMFPPATTASCIYSERGKSKYDIRYLSPESVNKSHASRLISRGRRQLCGCRPRRDSRGVPLAVLDYHTRRKVVLQSFRGERWVTAAAVWSVRLLYRRQSRARVAKKGRIFPFYFPVAELCRDSEKLRVGPAAASSFLYDRNYGGGESHLVSMYVSKVETQKTDAKINRAKTTLSNWALMALCALSARQHSRGSERRLQQSCV